MSFGLATFDSQGTLINSMTGRALRVVERFSVGQIEAGSKLVPGYGPHNAYVYSIPKGLPGQVGVSVYLLDGQIVWSYAWYYRPAYLCPSELILVVKL
nr:hypothetical protein FFPRI1PSEUD_14970 [Pseudomonas sp. FFPRI_1]